MNPPNDLVSLSDAASMSERSTRTLRRWIQQGKLSRHEGHPQDNGGSAPVLVSTSELLGHIASTGQEPRVDVSDTPGHPQSDTPDTRGQVGGGAVATQVDSVHLELATLRGELEQVRLAGELQAVRTERNSLALRLEETERRRRDEVAELRADLEDWRERHDAVRAELDALRKLSRSQSRGWWTRLLGGPVAAIPNFDEVQS